MRTGSTYGLMAEGYGAEELRNAVNNEQLALVRRRAEPPANYRSLGPRARATRARTSNRTSQASVHLTRATSWATTA